MEKPVEKFCNYCDCSVCRDGEFYLSTAKISETERICDVCYEIECCVDAKNKTRETDIEPCENFDCEHRPKLISGWQTFEEWKK